MKKSKLTTRLQPYKTLKKWFDDCELKSIEFEFCQRKMVNGERYYLGKKKLIFTFDEKKKGGLNGYPGKSYLYYQ